MSAPPTEGTGDGPSHLWDYLGDLNFKTQIQLSNISQVFFKVMTTTQTLFLNLHRRIQRNTNAAACPSPLHTCPDSTCAGVPSLREQVKDQPQLPGEPSVAVRPGSRQTPSLTCPEP